MSTRVAMVIRVIRNKKCRHEKSQSIERGSSVKFFAEGYGLVLSLHRHLYLKIQRISEIYKGKIFPHEF